MTTVILATLASLILLSLVALALQAWGVRRDGARHPPPGTLVDVGGMRLHIDCAGNGKPTVILEAGAGNWSQFWDSVRPRLVELTQVCAHDRAGLGWSDPRPGRRDSLHIAVELRVLLDAAGVSGPYVLVAHSMGALHARVFAHLYREDVAGVVLVDAISEGGRSYMPPCQARALMRRFRLARRLAPLGIVRLLVKSGRGAPLEAMVARLPRQTQPSLRAHYARPSTWRTALAEAEARPWCDAQVRAAGDLSDLPLRIVSAGRFADAGTREGWLEEQQRLAALSTRGEHSVVEESGHYIQLERQEAVVAAVRAVIEAARRRAPSARRG